MHEFYLKNYTICPKCGAKLELFEEKHLHCKVCGFNVYNNPAPSVAVAIWQDNKILLTQRGIEPFKNWWDLPGGFMISGENMEQTCLRELKEETGLDIQLTKYLGSQANIYQGQPTVIFFYQAKVLAGQEKPMDDVAKITWFDKDHLPDNIAFNYPKFALEK